jgi:general L-amino acid transport system permease protein
MTVGEGERERAGGRGSQGVTDTATAEPLPVIEDVPTVPAATPAQWIGANLFNSWGNSVLTVAFGALLVLAAVRGVRFVLVSGRWDVVRVNLTNFMVGRFPREQLHRPWTAIYIAAFVAGLAAGVHAGRDARPRWRESLRRAAPLLALLAVLLVLAETLVPLLLTAGSFAVGFAGRVVGQRLPATTRRYLPLLWILTIVVVFLTFTGFGGVGWDNWGGLLLTLYLAVAGIVLSFPIGVLLALGRRSTFPAVRAVCVGYIELIRGVPLITLLFMSALAIGFFLPDFIPRPGQVVRAIVAMVLFTAAYVAEIVRGGLQGVPPGQTEAAQALGMSPLGITRLIMLPQALRNVIPALVGQFISLFKDTSLVVVIPLLDLLGVAQVVHAQPDFRGQGLHAETLVFASFVYWAFCYSMSRASQRLEQRLGVGER